MSGRPQGERRKRFGPEFLPLNVSALFIRRPVATTLLTLAVLLAGLAAFALLPVAPLPQVDMPVVVVRASMPGAGPETMAATVATPLERALGHAADHAVQSQLPQGESGGRAHHDPVRHVGHADAHAAV